MGSGSGTTVMILCACPRPADFDETLHLLKYAATVQDVTTVVSKRRKVVIGMTYDHHGRAVKPKERRRQMVAAAAKELAGRTRKRTSDEAELEDDVEAGRVRARKSKRLGHTKDKSKCAHRRGTGASKSHHRHRGKGQSKRPSKAPRESMLELATRRARARAHGGGSSSSSSQQRQPQAQLAAAPKHGEGEESAMEGIPAELVAMTVHELRCYAAELVAQLEEAETRMATMEATVREEVSQAMAARIEELQRYYARKDQERNDMETNKMSSMMTLHTKRTATAQKALATRSRFPTTEAGLATPLLAVDLFGAAATAAGPGSAASSSSSSSASFSSSSSRIAGSASSCSSPALLPSQARASASASSATSASTRGSRRTSYGSSSCEEDLQAQVQECEEEMERMRAKHAAETNALQSKVRGLWAERVAASACSNCCSRLGLPTYLPRTPDC